MEGHRLQIAEGRNLRLPRLPVQLLGVNIVVVHGGAWRELRLRETRKRSRATDTEGQGRNFEHFELRHVQNIKFYRKCLGRARVNWLAVSKKITSIIHTFHVWAFRLRRSFFMYVARSTFDYCWLVSASPRARSNYLVASEGTYTMLKRKLTLMLKFKLKSKLRVELRTSDRVKSR